MKHVSLMLACFALVAGSSLAQFVESEPNDNKAQANVVAGLAAGGTITGTCTGTTTTGTGVLTSADYFDITTGALAAGIYEHVLTLTSTITTLQSMSIQGLNQTAGAVGTPGVIGTTDTSFQTGLLVGTTRIIKWYGFGRSERLYVRVTGSATTTGTYTLTLSTTAVTPIAGPCLQAGTITISTVGQTTVDTDTWVYDSGRVAIPGYGNDDEFGTTNLQSKLTRTFAAGTYFFAISRFAGANNLPSPGDDDFRTGTVLDFADIHACSSSSTASGILNTAFTDGAGTQITAATVAAAFRVMWIQFNVVPPSPAIAWETNGPGLDININGVQGTAGAPANVSVCVGQTATLNATSTNTGFGWVIGFGLAPGVSGPTACSPGTGGVPTPNGQVINLNVFDPTLQLTAVPPFPAFPAGGVSVPFSFPLPFANISIQGLVFSASHPDGYELSQLTQLHIINPAPVAGPTADDSSVTLNLGAAPLCGPSSLTFCGTAYTQMHVISNGRVMFSGVAGDTDFSPTVAEALLDNPWVGYWADWEPNAQGTITVSSTPTSVNVDYVNVRYWGEATAPNSGTYRITFNTSGTVVLDGLLGINADPNPTASSVNQQLMGLFCGPTSTDPGATTFTNGGSGCSLLPTDALYDFEAGLAVTGPYRVPSLNAGTLNRITFTPQPLGGYCWSGS